MPGSAHIIRADAGRLPLRPGSVHLAVASPPYYGLRWYPGAGTNQIGSEPTPQDHLRALWAVSDQVWTALWDQGSWFVNLGEKYSQSGGHNNSGISKTSYSERRCPACGETTTRMHCHNGCGVPMQWTRNAGDKGSVQAIRSTDGISSKSTLRGNGHVGGVGKAGPNKIKATRRVCPECGGKRRLFPTEEFRAAWIERWGNDDRIRDGVPCPACSDPRATRRTAPDRYVQNPDWARPKSLMGLPWAFALGMVNPALYRNHIDPPPPGRSHPQWILRAEVVWSKLNGLPESVDDRVRRAHETILHFTKSEHYFAAVDEIREPHAAKTLTHRGGGVAWGNDENPDNNWGNGGERRPDPRGALPSSVWRFASEPLKLPTWRVVRGGRTVAWFLPRPAPKSSPGRDMAYEDALKWMRAMGLSGGRPSLRPVQSHFAAFPSAIPEKVIRGWSPSGICMECGEPRRPVVDKKLRERNRNVAPERYAVNPPDGATSADWYANTAFQGSTEATILGYACACPEPTTPTRPSVILDPFAGTGTTLLVAKALGRIGIGTELSHPYAKLAEWRCTHEGAKTEARAWQQAQGSLL